MAKNITIAEGSQAKNFNTVHKLRTNLIGSGTQYWVPEDEAGVYAKMSEKSITANGTYRASDDDKDGYSQVTVNVQPRVTSKSINENGRYYANSDGYEGYSSVEVNVAGGRLIEKNITTNGLYSASSEGADGYSQVNVNVNRVVAVDSSIDGGNDNEYLIDTTKNGDVTIIRKTLVPSSILITTSPNKKNYITGEDIDITGMVVKAYKRDGTLWTSEDYPNGIIPNSELEIDPKKVTISPGHRRKSNGAGVNVLEVRYEMQKNQSWYASQEFQWLPTGDEVLGRYGGQPLTVGSRFPENDGAKFYLTRYLNKIYAYGINMECNVEARVRRLQDGFWGRDYSSSDSAGFNSWNEVFTNYAATYASSLEIPTSLVDPRNVSVATLSSNGMMINVKWARPQDGQVLVDLLPIKVSAAD